MWRRPPRSTLASSSAASYVYKRQELETIEKFIGALLYPLKNTLLYFQAIQSAHTDPLTGVLNRSTLQSVFQKETSLSKRHHSDLTLVALDIDFFKAVNDTYGHAAGDLALQEVTTVLYTHLTLPM